MEYTGCCFSSKYNAASGKRSTSFVIEAYVAPAIVRGFLVLTTAPATHPSRSSHGCRGVIYTSLSAPLEHLTHPHQLNFEFWFVQTNNCPTEPSSGTTCRRGADVRVPSRVPRLRNDHPPTRAIMMAIMDGGVLTPHQKKLPQGCRTNDYYLEFACRSRMRFHPDTDVHGIAWF